MKIKLAIGQINTFLGDPETNLKKHLSYSHNVIEDGLIFWGGSTEFDPKGRLLAQGSYFEEAMIITNIDLNRLHRTHARGPFLREERTGHIQREIDRLVNGVREYHG